MAYLCGDSLSEFACISSSWLTSFESSQGTREQGSILDVWCSSVMTVRAATNTHLKFEVFVYIYETTYISLL